ncbi:MAG TPA: hypothetical protein VFP26_01025 [Gemmatimonadaceae bacterium]|nr:hypothetical protein [Gemmatimonadaceae bacterium]
MFNMTRRRDLADGARGRVWKGCVAAFLMGVASGCYVYSPAPASPGQGTQLVLQLNDRGRVALGDSIGPTGQEVEGKVVGTSDSALSLSVARVGYLNGQSNKWNGERLTIGRSLFDQASERRFSASRTWLTVAVAVGAVAAFIGSRSLLGFGSEGRTNNGGGGNQQ